MILFTRISTTLPLFCSAQGKMIPTHSFTIMTKSAIPYMSLKPVVTMKAINDTKETPRALSAGVLAYNSPRSAPMNGPRIIPGTEKKNPTSNPNVAPHTPALEPPLRFVNHTRN